MDTEIDVAHDGYLATFHGQLSGPSIDEVRQWAFEEFAERPLRWAVMDLTDAAPRPVQTIDDEQREVESLDRVARGVRDARTNSLRLAIVADAAMFGSLIELMDLIVQRRTELRTNIVREIERFDDVATARAWAADDTSPHTGE
ncbi:MAG: hypothetical protein AAF081_04355 [Actinomycetota bacterium]